MRLPPFSRLRRSTPLSIVDHNRLLAAVENLAERGDSGGNTWVGGAGYLRRDPASPGIWAKIDSVITTGHTTPVYSFHEVYQTYDGVWNDRNDGLWATTYVDGGGVTQSVPQAYEFSGSSTVPVGTVVWMWAADTPDTFNFYATSAVTDSWNWTTEGIWFGPGAGGGGSGTLYSPVIGNYLTFASVTISVPLAYTMWWDTTRNRPTYHDGTTTRGLGLDVYSGALAAVAAEDVVWGCVNCTFDVDYFKVWPTAGIPTTANVTLRDPIEGPIRQPPGNPPPASMGPPRSTIDPPAGSGSRGDIRTWDDGAASSKLYQEVDGAGTWIKTSDSRMAALADLLSAKIIVGNASNVAAQVSLSGDASLSNTGALTIGNSAITTAKIADENVTTGKMAALAITAAKLAADAVTTAKITDAAVSKAKIENVAADKLLGRGNGGGAGAPQEITLGTGLSMSGTTLNSTGSGSGTTLTWTKYTKTFDDFNNGTNVFSESVTLVTPAAGTIIHDVKVKHTTTWAGGTFSNVICGVYAEVDTLLLADNQKLFAATGDDIWVGGYYANIPYAVNGQYGAVSRAITLVVTVASDWTSTLTAGVVDVWLLTSTPV